MKRLSLINIVVSWDVYSWWWSYDSGLISIGTRLRRERILITRAVRLCPTCLPRLAVVDGLPSCAYLPVDLASRSYLASHWFVPQELYQQSFPTVAFLNCIANSEHTRTTSSPPLHGPASLAFPRNDCISYQVHVWSKQDRVSSQCCLDFPHWSPRRLWVPRWTDSFGGSTKRSWVTIWLL